jgi:Spy/CpxP family protein refolding chaperone
MNRWMSRALTVSAVVVGLAASAGGVALADGQPSGEHAGQGKHHHGGLVQAALKLDSLSTVQRQQIGQIESARKAAEVPVRQANAVVLTQLAKQVEQARIDRQGLQGSLSTEEAAAQAARSVDVQTLTQLHGILSAQQRNQLVDGIEARIPAGKPRPQQLESFRGDTFDASTFVKARVPGEHVIAMAEKKVPGMTPAQRSEFASHLRERAARANKA